jgi:flagellar hook-associated protein 2
MQNNIQAFIDSYNAVQDDITNETEITSVNGSVTTSPLSNDVGVVNLGGQLRDAVFAAVPGISNSIARIEDIGIDFAPDSNNLTITDNTTLTNAIANNPSQVAAFFQQSSTGFAANLTGVLNEYLGQDGLPGEIANEQTNLTSENADITKQIATIETSLAAEQAQMTTEFEAMQNAESSYSQMQSVLNADFGNNSNTSSTNSTSASSSSSSSSG